MAVKKLEVRLTGNSRDAEQAFDRTGASADGLGSKVGGLGRVAAVASAAVVAGVGAIAVKGGQAAMEFQTGMNEVFTLIPGASQQAMDAMTDDVKRFSTEFGVLPEKVVPALYQSLSAGVPQDNVFAFLETAQMAAKGGVTELETAVDGISSTINAYGTDVLSAEQASDQMFTAVKLGKTTFDELSRSLFQVNPIASSLGVDFGDVTAALAAMTAQGVPTSVATTQLRQAFVEMSKEGSKTASTFEELSGKTFKDFIAEGGNTQEALQLLEQHAKDSGVGINDLFGSVEAGAAALALTGGGTEKFTAAMAGMEDSAGATEAAFNQMEKGLGPVINKIKARVQVGLINIGDALAPFVERAFNAVLAVMGPVQVAFDAGMASARMFFNALRTGMTEDEGTPVERLALVLRDRLIPVFERTVEVGRALASFVREGLGAAAEWVSGSAIPGMVSAFGQLTSAFQRGSGDGFFGDLGETARTAYDWITGTAVPGIQSAVGSLMAGLKGEGGEGSFFTDLGEAAVTFGGWLQNTVLPAAQRLFSYLTGDGKPILIAIGIAFAAIAAPVATAVAAFVFAYQKFSWFRTGVAAILGAIRTYFQSFWLPTFVFAWNTVQTYIGYVRGYIDTLRPWIAGFLNVVSTYFTTIWWPALQRAWDAVSTYFGLVKSYITNVIIPAFKAVWSVVGPVLGAVAGKVTWFWTSVVFPVFSAVVGFIGSELVPRFLAFRDNAVDVWNVVSGAVSGAWSGISAVFTAIKDGISGVATWISDRIDDAVGFFDRLKSGISDAMSNVADAISGPFERAFSAVKSMWNSTVGGFGFDVPSWVPGVGGRSFNIPTMHTGGVVPGGAATEVLRKLQGGEVVLSRDDVARLGNIMGPTTSRRPAPIAHRRGGDTIHLHVHYDGAVLGTDIDRVADDLQSALLRMQARSPRPILPGVS